MIPESSVGAIFDPLKDCPPGRVERYKKAAEQARDGVPFKSIKLKCLDCCGWEHGEAKQCENSSCALWLLNGRIFGRES